MAGSLTQTAFWARLFIKYGIAFIIFLVLGRILLTFGVNVYHHFSPPPPPKPTVSYGKLPAISFPESSEKKYSLTLELPEGDLPIAPASLPVYVIPKKSAFLGALDEARKIAQSLRFTKNEESISPTISRWTQESANVYLDMNIITQTFAINSDLYQDANISSLDSPNQQSAVSIIRSFLQTANLFPKDFTDGKTLTTLIKNDGSNLVIAGSLSEANFVRVDFLRQNYNDFPVVTPHPGQGNIWFLVSGTSDPGKGIIAGEYHYFPVDGANDSTYPIKTSDTAWKELQDGKGIIVSAPDRDSIVIRRVYLAYYDSDEYQPFFQPIYVFEGDNGFVGYVPGVNSDYYGD